MKDDSIDAQKFTEHNCYILAVHGYINHYLESNMSEAHHTSPAVELGEQDLPAYCPNPAMPLWSSHPRVYLEINHGEAKCPYCGTLYRLKPGTVVKGH